MTEVMYDLGIMTSIIGLMSLYFITIFIIISSIISGAFTKFTKYPYIPKIVPLILEHLWLVVLKKNVRDAILSLIIIGLSIIPASLVWIILYPTLFILIGKYYNKYLNTICPN